MTSASSRSSEWYCTWDSRPAHRSLPHVPIEEHPQLDDEPSIDAWIERAEEHVAVLGCVQRLVEIQRHVVTLRLLDEMSNGEVAAALALQPGTVAVHLHRAKLALQRCLAD